MSSGRIIHVPIDVRSRGEVDDPGLHPALETRRGELPWIGGVARGQRLEDMEGAQVARGPEHEGNDRQHASAENVSPGTRASQGRQSCKAAIRENDDGQKARNRQQRAIRPQQCGIAPAHRQQQTRGPSGTRLRATQERRRPSAIQKIESVSLSGAATKFAVKGHKAARYSAHIPARCPAMARVVHATTNDDTRSMATCRVQHSAVMVHAEDAKARGQKERIAGKTDERRLHRGARRGELRAAIDAVQQPILGDVSIGKSVAVHLRKMPQKPEAQPCPEPQG